MYSGGGLLGGRAQISELELEGLCTCPKPALISMEREDEVGLGLPLLCGPTLETQQLQLTFAVHLLGAGAVL